jgi:hypothetical protein
MQAAGNRQQTGSRQKQQTADSRQQGTYTGNSRQQTTSETDNSRQQTTADSRQ